MAINHSLMIKLTVRYFTAVYCETDDHFVPSKILESSEKCPLQFAKAQGDIFKFFLDQQYSNLKLFNLMLHTTK